MYWVKDVSGKALVNLDKMETISLQRELDGNWTILAWPPIPADPRCEASNYTLFRGTEAACHDYLETIHNLEW
jgi:hypothetical protein